MATLTPLSTILARMNRWQTISTVEEQYKVYDLDEAIRTLRRDYQFPWTLQKGSIRVFSDILEYPVPTDFDEIAYVDNNQTTNFGDNDYANRARFKYTSLQQFYENPDDRNDLCEIWDGNTKFIGIRYRNQSSIGSGQLLNSAETLSDWSSSGDSGTPVLDTVNFKEGNSSIRIPITYSTGTATVSSSINSFSDANYKRKYYFVWVYFTTIPTSVNLKLGNNSTNYLYSNVTSQFAGQGFKANQWNLLAFDLNTALEAGTFDSSSIDYQQLDFAISSDCTIYIDASYLREWNLMDFWYFSKYNIATSGNTTANQEYFMDSLLSYSTDSSIIGDSEWIDCVMYDAMLTSILDKENNNIYEQIKEKRDLAWSNLLKNYPSLKPVIITDKYRFINEFNNPNYYERY